MTRSLKTTSDLITDVATELYWPTSESARPLTNVQLLAKAERIIEADIWPMLVSAKEDYATAVWDIPVADPAIYEHANAYALPGEAMMRIESVYYVDTSRKEYLIPPGHENYAPNDITGFPVEHFYRGNRLCFWPAPKDGTVRIRFNPRPYKLIAHTSDTHVRIIDIANVGGTSESYSVDHDPSFSLLTDMVIVSQQPPHVPVEFIPFENITSVPGSDLLVVRELQWPGVSKSIAGRAKVEDYIFQGENTSILQIPIEAYPLLLAELVLSCDRSRADQNRIQVLEGDAARKRMQLEKFLKPRSNSQSRAYVPAMRRASRNIYRGWRQ